MSGPEEVYFMSRSVHPVVGAVVDNRSDYPGGGAVPGKGVEAVVVVDVDVDAEQRGSVQHAKREIHLIWMGCVLCSSKKPVL